MTDEANRTGRVGYWGQLRSERATASRLFLHAFVPLLLVLLLASLALHLLHMHTLTRELDQSAQTLLDLVGARFERELYGPIEDLRFLSRELQTQPATRSPEAILRLRNLSATRQQYDAIHMLDATGRQLARIDRADHGAGALDPTQLTNWATNPVFAATLEMQPGEVFVAPFALRSEDGRVSEPLQPILRFAVPLFDVQQRLAGMIVIDLDARPALEILTRTDTFGSFELLSNDGYWIKARDPALEWGSVLREREQSLFSSQFAQAWGEMANAQNGVVRTRQGDFWFRTVSAPRAHPKTPTWRLVLHASPEFLRTRELAVGATLIGSSLLSALLIAPFLWRLAKGATRQAASPS